MNLSSNLLLAVLWAAVIGPFTPANLAVGFVLGYIALRASTGFGKRAAYITRVTHVVELGVFTIVELVVANLRVAWYTVSSLKSLNPAVLRVPLEPGLTDAEITLISTLITLTPGTLTLDVVDNRGALLVHFMHVDDSKEAIESIKQGFEKRVMRATR